jgi:PAS domain S-box-containing protein
MQKILHRQQKTAVLNCVVVFTISSLVLTAYQFDLWSLKNLFIGQQLSNPVSALDFGAAGISLLLLTQQKKSLHWIGKLLAISVFLCGGLRFLETFIPFHSGVDHWLFPGKLELYGDGGKPNLMTSHTALLFCLLGAALLSYRFRMEQKNLLCDYLAFLVAVLSFFCLVSYLYNSTELYHIKSSIAMAFPTVVSFFLLSTAILLKRSAFGFFSLFTRPYIGSKIARFLMPMAVVIPIAGGVFQSYGVKWGLFSVDMGEALVDTINVLLLILFIRRCCLYLNKENKAYNLEMKKRIQAEERARMNEEFLNALIENLPEMIFVKDASFRFVRVNKATEEMVQIPRERLIGKLDEDFFPPEQALHFREKDLEAFHQSEIVTIREEQVGSGAALRWLHTKKIIVEGADGQRFLLGISQDITERKEMEHQLRGFNRELEQKVVERTRELQQKEKEKRQLQRSMLQEQLNMQRSLMQATIDGQEKEKKQIGMELHDNINQVLTSTKLYLELARSDETLREEMLGKCQTQINYAIQEIRSLSKSLVPHGVETGGLREGVIQIIEAIQLSAAISFQTDLCEKALNQLDTTQQLTLYRIIQEQINNIVKHAAACRVLISLKSVEGRIALCIQDDGKGFEVSSKPSGIGLSNIKSRIEVLQGTMEIHSAPGEGCTLQVFFHPGVGHLAA